MNDFIKTLVNYVIEAKIKDYRGYQSAETYRLSRINREISPSDAPADRAAKFHKINADYKEEKRLERAPRGPQTRKKPMDEGAKEGIVDAASRGIEAVDKALGYPLTRRIRRDARNIPLKPGVDLQSQGLIVSPTRSIPHPNKRPRIPHSSEDPNNKYYIGPPIKEGAEPRRAYLVRKPMDEGAKELWDLTKKFGGEVVQTGKDVRDAVVGGHRLPPEPKEEPKEEPRRGYLVPQTKAERQKYSEKAEAILKLRQERLKRELEKEEDGEHYGKA